MNNKYLVILAFLASSSLAFANNVEVAGDVSYLEVEEQQGYYTEVQGDGYELGFAVNISLFSKTQHSSPQVIIPAADNMASCELTQIKLVKSSFIHNFCMREYRLVINTQIWADTGGCLVWIKSDLGETIKIINYTYITEGY